MRTTRILRYIAANRAGFFARGVRRKVQSGVFNSASNVEIHDAGLHHRAADCRHQFPGCDSSERIPASLRRCEQVRHRKVQCRRRAPRWGPGVWPRVSRCRNLPAVVRGKDHQIGAEPFPPSRRIRIEEDRRDGEARWPRPVRMVSSRRREECHRRRCALVQFTIVSVWLRCDIGPAGKVLLMLV